MKIKDKLLKSIAFGAVLISLFSVDSNAIDGNVDLTYKSIVRTLGDYDRDVFNSVIETKDKGLVAVGTSYGTDLGFVNKGGKDAVVIKYDKNGNQQWIKSFGGSGTDIFNSVVETSDGGIVAVGYSTSTSAGFNNKGYSDAIIVKYDSIGNQQWIKSFGGSNDDYFASVIETSDGCIVAVGDSGSKNIGFTNKGGGDAIVVKYDSEGNELWIKNFGGSKKDYFKSVIETNDKGIVAVGYSNSTDAGFTAKGDFDAIVVKYDSNGNQQWIRSMGGSKKDCFNSVAETSDGGIVSVGYSDSTNAGFTNKGLYDGIIVKYDSNGNQQWIKNFGGFNDDRLYSIIKAQNGEFIVSGDSSPPGIGYTNKGGYDAVVVNYDKDGNQQWIKNFGGSAFDHFYNITATHNGGFIAVGESFSSDAGFDNKGSYDAVIVKYNSICKEFEEVFDEVRELELNKGDLEQFSRVRNKVNKIYDEEVKNYLNEKLNNISVDIELELKTLSANIDIYIKCENALKMTLDTNSIAFEDFSGVKDVEKSNAINIAISSSLPYQLNAYLPTEIQNSDKTNTMDKRILNIKESSESDYKEFTNINEKVVLKDNCSAGNDLLHGIDIKLKGGVAHEKDVYKTTIKFEAEQK